MKKSTLVLFLLLLLSLSACRQTPQNPSVMTEDPIQTQLPETNGPEQSADATVTPSVVPQKPLAAVFVPSVTEKVCADDGTEIFAYTHQSMSLVLQEVEIADKIILDFLNRSDTASTAQQLLASARNAYAPSEHWVAYMCKVLYEPMRIDQSVLSLFGTHSMYSGGMHPEHLAVSVSYDLLTGDVLTLGSIMHKDATREMFRDLVLQDLEARKEELYLFSDYADGVNERFSLDESLDEAFYFSQNGLCFYFSPYQIAPYASGMIVSEIPYEKLVGLINDAYFPGEKHLTDGTIVANHFSDMDLETVTRISEAVLTPGGEMVMLTADNTVENIRIEFYSADPRVGSYTLFAASALAPGDGILIEATQEQLTENIRVYYSNAGGLQLLTFTE